MKNFHTLLRSWHLEHARDLPWAGEKDAYKIWISEIILQQTRVEHGIDYYHAFIKKFPDVNALAAASEDTVLKMWEGLGYYSRARNLHASAKIIVKEMHGIFPSGYDAIRLLKGVGDYTAAAIASFAYGLTYAVVDANVIRILCRIFGLREDTGTPAVRKKINALAQSLLPSDAAAQYNQAIMDFGALICKPKNPLCSECVFQKYCYAFQNDLVEVLPLKKQAITKRKRYFHYLVIRNRKNTIIEKRLQKDIWINLYQFPLIEDKRMLSFHKLKNTPAFKNLLVEGEYSLAAESESQYQQLSHQSIQARFFTLEVQRLPRLQQPMITVPVTRLSDFAFPGIIRESLKELL